MNQLQVAFVYMLKCSDASLYTGYTINVEKRLQQHIRGAGSKYVRARRPFTFVYLEKCASRSAAMQRERQIKKFTRKRKLELLTMASNLLQSKNSHSDLQSLIFKYSRE